MYLSVQVGCGCVSVTVSAQANAYLLKIYKLSTCS